VGTPHAGSGAGDDDDPTVEANLGCAHAPAGTDSLRSTLSRDALGTSSTQ
jgi:hypothetical protein